MFDEDDDDNDTQSRYPSIPSLVALQMMKNRLQLANLGRRLMKWSSMATGKELRKRAVEMNREFKDYGEQVANAYLLLARARFYNPDMNKSVLQNVGHNAACVVDFETRTLIGVRFFHMTLIERNHDPNLHLGLEKGGGAITAAKQAWRELLKEMILMLETETAFQRIYVANKSATKKQNVLGKVIVPKITNAIAYIKSELEEKEREETFRLKRFKFSKAKKMARLERERILRTNFIEPETIIEEPEVIEVPEKVGESKISGEPKISEEPEKVKELEIEETDILAELRILDEPQKIEEPEKVKELEIEETDILAELRILDEPQKVEEPEKFDESEKIEPKVMLLQIETSKQKLVKPVDIAVDTYVPEDIVSEIIESEVVFSGTVSPEHNIAEVVPEVKLQEPDIILPDFIIQGEPSPFERQHTFMPEIIFEGKPPKVAKDWGQFVKSPPYKDMSETTSIKQPMDTAVSCPLCTAETDDTNQRVLHLIEHVNQFLMLCKQNEIDFTKLESKGDKFNYKNIKKELELVSYYSCPHKSTEERSKGDIGKVSCLIQRSDRSYTCSSSMRKKGKEHESIYKCLSSQSSAMPNACKQTQINDITSNGSVITFFSTNCRYSFHSQSMADAKYFDYCSLTPEFKLQYGKTQNPYPSTSTRKEEDYYGTQTSTHYCTCPSRERSLSISGNRSPNTSNNSPYFKKSPTYYTSMPQTHYASLNRNLQPYFSKNITSNISSLLPNPLPMALFAAKNPSWSYRIPDLIYMSNWTNIIVPKEFATVATYQPSNLFSPYKEDRFDSYNISDTFKSVDSSNTIIRNDSLTCMTVLPQGYPGVVPYMSRFGFTDIINNNSTNFPGSKGYAKVHGSQCCKDLVPHTSERRPESSSLSNDISSLFFIASDSTSCSSDDTASISGISDTEINEDCINCIVSQKDENLEIAAQNEKFDPRNLSPHNSESTNELGDKLKNKNYSVYVILTPDQNWPFNSYMREQKLKKNVTNYQINGGYQEQGSSSKTRSYGACKRNDYSVYVTLTPSQNSRFKPMRRETKQTRENKFDSANSSGTATYIDSATYVTTVKRKSKSGSSCTRCGKCVTSYMTCSECTDSIQTTSGFNGVFDVRNVTATESYPVPYTREGKPGYSDVSVANDEQFRRAPYTRVGPFNINNFNSPPITFSAPFTREGKPGPFHINEASNINTTVEPVPHTREGRPGPFDFFKTSNVNAPKSVTSSVKYTREGRAGPYEISESNNNTATKQFAPSVPYTRENRLPNDISEASNSPAKNILCTPENQECGPGKCGVYSVVCVYTSEGKPRHCGLIEVCKNTCSKPCSSSNGRKCGNFDASEMDNSAACDSIAPCLPYTREGRTGSNDVAPTIGASCTPNTQEFGPGRCGVYNVVSVYTSQRQPKHCGLIEICENTCSKPRSPSNGGKCGNFDTTGINNTTVCNSITPCLPYRREGRPGSNDVAPTIGASCTPNTQEFGPGQCGVYNVVSVYTSQGQPKHCGLIEICKNTCSKPCSSSNGGKCGNFNTAEINNTTVCNSITPCLPYTREGRPGSNDVAPTIGASCTPNTQEFGPGRCGVYNVVSVYTSQGQPKHCGLIEICKNTCSKPCSSSNGGKCGNFNTTEINNTTVCNSITPCLPYTREDRPGSNDVAPTIGASCTPNRQEFGPGRCGVYNVVSVYTSQGQARHCGLIEICKNTCSKPCSPPDGGKCGQFVTSESRKIAPYSSITPCLPYTREGAFNACGNPPVKIASSPSYTQECGPGRCGVYGIVCVYTGEGEPQHCGLIEICRSPSHNPQFSSTYTRVEESRPCGSSGTVTSFIPYTREAKHGPCGIFEKGNVITTKHNETLPYTREGRPGPFDVSKMNHTTAPNQITPYTREGRPGPFGITDKNYISTKQIESVPYTREGRPGPFDNPVMRNTTASKQIKLYTREGRPGPFEIPENADYISIKEVGAVPYTREGRPGPFDISEMCNTTALNQIKPYTREGRPGPFEIPKKTNYISIKEIGAVPYTREGRPGPFDISEMSKTIASSQIKPYTREGRPGPFDILDKTETITSKQIEPVPYTREGKPGPFGISEERNMTTTKIIAPEPYTREGKPGPFDISDMGKNTVTEQVTPYTREGKPGPFGISEERHITTTKIITPQPYTREGKPGPFDISDMGKNTATEQVTPPYTREGKPGPFGISEERHITTTKIITPQPYTREGKPGPFDISDMGKNTATEQVTPPYTREGKPGPFDISDMSKNIVTKQVTPYTREGKPGPFGISDESNLTTKIITPAPYTREGKPGPFDISEMSNNTATEQVTPYTREGKPGPFDISEVNKVSASTLNKSSAPHTLEGTPGPFYISGASNTTTAKQINDYTAPKLPKPSPPYTRESIPRPCGFSEPSNMNDSFMSYREPCEVYSIICGYTREGTLGPCCSMKINDSTTPIPGRSPSPYTREGKAGPFSISEISIITTSKQCGPKPYTREGRPGPFEITKTKYSEPKEPYKREGKPGPCGILDENNIACPKHLTSCTSCKRNGGICETVHITASYQFEPMPYTREGRPGPFDICKTIGEKFETSEDLTTVAAPRAYTREGRPGPLRLSAISNVLPKKEIPDTTCYNVFMATTDQCRCGFDAPSTQKKASSSATSDKSDQSCIETEYKKHTKNLRYTECDGTIVDEKRITIIKIKKRKPEKQNALEANKSTCISQNLEGGTDLECRCCKQSKSENLRSTPDVMPCPKMRTSISTQVLKTGNCVCGEPPEPPPIPCPNKPSNSGSSPKCDCGIGGSSKPSSISCPNKPDASASGPQCKCEDKGPTCKCGDAPPEPPLVCANRLEDSPSGPKCDCGAEASKPPPPVCANRLEDSASGPKCNCGEKSSKPASLVCTNRLEDSASGPKCNCGEKLSKPPSLVCANRLEDSASGPKCNCGEKSTKPPPLVCANRLEDSASGPKCDCGGGAPPKPPLKSILVCANRLEDSASGPKCDCGDKAPPKPPPLVCANRLEDSASGPKCDCGQEAPKPPPLVCGNRLEDSASGPKCDCGKKTSEPPSLVCANRLEDSASGPKCDCGTPPTPPPIPCPNKSKDSGSVPMCSCGAPSKPPPIPCPNKPKDSASDSKCSCGAGAASEKSSSIECPNKPKDTTSGPKCKCAPPKSESGPKCDCTPPPIPCPNKPKDSGSNPKCNCGDTGPKCKCKDKAASGPKCACEGGAASKKSSSIECPNKPKDSASGPKCECRGGNKAKSSSSDSGNRVVDLTGPKCECGDKAASKPSSPKCKCAPPDSESSPNCECTPSPAPCPNKPKDSASGPKCECGGGNKAKKSNSNSGNRVVDLTGPKCECGDKAASKPSSPKCKCAPPDSESGPNCECTPPPAPCPNKPKDSASGPKCECGGGNKAKKSNSNSGNRVVDLTGPKCECGDKAASKPSSTKCNCAPPDSESGPNCDCTPPPVPCPNKPKDSASGPKCECGGGNKAKTSSSDSGNRVVDLTGPKCECGNKAASKPTSAKCKCAPPDLESGPECECGGGNKPKNSSSNSGNRVVDLTGPKCECGDKAASKPSSAKCKCAPPDSESGPECECGGGNKPKNSSSNSGNRVVDLTGPKCECGDKASSKRASKPKDSASGAKCQCVKEEQPAPSEQGCCKSSSKTNNGSKKTGNTPKCECSEKTPPKPKSGCGGGASANTCGGSNKVEETCQTGIPDYPLCACTGEVLSKALLQKVLNTLRCQNSPVICAPPDKPNRHANCFTDSSPSGSNPKKSCGLCGSPIAHKEPPTKATCVCSDSSVHAAKKSKTNKNTTCGFCTFGSHAQKSNGPSTKTCEDNKNYRPCNLAKDKYENVATLCTSASINNKNKDDSFCTVKIITKSQKSRCCGTEYQSSFAFTATSALEALRRLCRSPVHKMNKNICQTCFSPLSDSIASDIQEKPSPLCEFCQDKLVQQSERGYRCTTYGVDTPSCRSGSPSRSVYSQKTNQNTRGCGNNCKK